MTSEDEAFIRAIVDSPGDDTPRLVYADWLQDRDDPRGPYLRAEHEWAKKRTAVALKKVRKLAKPLDAVWLARVSRPPIGVCCDHIAFTDGGPLLTESDVSGFEKRCRVTLPAEYRAFLLNHNGGCPSLNATGSSPDYLSVWLNRFYSLNETRPKRGTSLEREIDNYRTRITPQSLERFQELSAEDVRTYCNAIPIASWTDVIFTLLIATNKSSRPGTLGFIDWTVEVQPWSAYNVIPRLSLLLDKLTIQER